MTWLDTKYKKLQGIFPGLAKLSHFSPVSPMIFMVIHIGTGYLNRPNWLLAGFSVYNRVASWAFPGFPAHNVYDRAAISAPVTVRAEPQCLWQARDLAASGGARGTRERAIDFLVHNGDT